MGNVGLSNGGQGAFSTPTGTSAGGMIHEQMGAAFGSSEKTDIGNSARRRAILRQRPANSGSRWLPRLI